MFKLIKKKIEKYIVSLIEKHYKDKFLNIECRLSDHRRFIQANGEDISTLFKSIHVGADVHYKGNLGLLFVLKVNQILLNLWI